jgi:hypothetical protein
MASANASTVKVTRTTIVALLVDGTAAAYR